MKRKDVDTNQDASFVSLSQHISLPLSPHLERSQESWHLFTAMQQKLPRGGFGPGEERVEIDRQILVNPTDHTT